MHKVKPIMPSLNESQICYDLPQSKFLCTGPIQAFLSLFSFSKPSLLSGVRWKCKPNQCIHVSLRMQAQTASTLPWFFITEDKAFFGESASMVHSLPSAPTPVQRQHCLLICNSVQNQRRHQKEREEKTRDKTETKKVKIIRSPMGSARN